MSNPTVKGIILRSQLVAIAITAFSLVGLYNYMLIKNLKHSQLSKQYSETLRFSDHIDTVLNQRLSLLSRINLLDYHVNFRDLSLIENFVGYSDVFPVLAYLDKDATEKVKVVFGKQSEQLLSHSGELWLQKIYKTPNKVYHSPLQTIGEIKHKGIRAGVAKFGYFGDEFQGILLGAIPLTILTENIDREFKNRPGFYFLVDGNQRIIHCSQDQQIASKIIGRTYTSFPVTDSFQGGVLDETIINEKGFFSWSQLKGPDWTLVIFYPYSEFKVQPAEIMMYAAIVAFCALFVGFCIAHVISKPILRDVKKAIEHIKLISLGKMKEMQSMDSCDELISLGDSVNEMTRNLERSVRANDSLNKLLHSIIDPLLVTDSSGKIIKVNDASVRLFQLRSEMSDKQMFQDFFYGKGLFDDFEKFKESLYVTPMVNFETRVTVSLDVSIAVLLSCSLINREQVEESGVVCIIKDISDLKRAEEQIKQLAYYDPLTLLANRTLLINRLEQAILRGNRDYEVSGFMFGVLFMDIDRFKLVNDSLGHNVGDQLLIAVSERLKKLLRKGDTLSRPFMEDHTLARLGGDEFVIHMPLVREPRDAAMLCSRITKAMSEPFEIKGHQLFSPVSIGIALYPVDGKDVDTLLKHADIAMYHAKKDGRNTFHFYSNTMDKSIRNRLRLESQFRKALQEWSGFSLVYQPKISVKDYSICGVEALLRWTDDEFGFVSPVDFIPVAEETGLIVELGERVLYMACEQMKQWQAAGLPEFHIAVNFSGKQITHAGVQGMVEECLQVTRLDPRLLELEITESSLLETAEKNIQTLHSLKKLGVVLAVDDFGTGYSSLAYLKRFPIDIIKIDRAFIMELDRNADDEAIVRATIAMSHSLNLRVVAEGVETIAQAEMLRDLECEEIQGYLFGKPMPPEELEKLVSHGGPIVPHENI